MIVSFTLRSAFCFNKAASFLTALTALILSDWMMTIYYIVVSFAEGCV